MPGRSREHNLGNYSKVMGDEELNSVYTAGFFFFFFGLFITRKRPIRSWRGYVQSVSCLLSAQCRHIASSPLPSAQACRKKM